MRVRNLALSSRQSLTPQLLSCMKGPTVTDPRDDIPASSSIQMMPRRNSMRGTEMEHLLLSLEKIDVSSMIDSRKCIDSVGPRQCMNIVAAGAGPYWEHPLKDILCSDWASGSTISGWVSHYAKTRLPWPPRSSSSVPTYEALLTSPECETRRGFVPVVVENARSDRTRTLAITGVTDIQHVNTERIVVVLPRNRCCSV